MSVRQYKDLFVHRSDVFAEQHPDGSYRPVRRPLGVYDIQRHMRGNRSFGTYVIDPADQTVGYVVFDLDTYDEAALAFLTRAVEDLLDSLSCDDLRHALLLESSGGKGYHIWCFFDERVPARQARAWAAPVKEEYDKMVATQRHCALDAPPGYEPTAWPALEIFPKQDEVPEGGFGNLVKLPLGVHAKSGNHSEILGCEGWAKSVDSVQRLPSALLPEVPEVVGATSPSGSSGATRFPCVNRILEDGAPQGVRDNAMLHLAHYARGCGLPEDMALQWCLQANEEFSPPLTRQEVNQKVASAYRLSAPHPSCNQDWLRDFCPGGMSCCASSPVRSGRSLLDEWRERND